jgi:hypothetical protein
MTMIVVGDGLLSDGGNYVNFIPLSKKTNIKYKEGKIQ